MIKDFTILGERCSGTNFLEAAIKTNFKINHTERYGHKHFFGHSKFSNTSSTLFIGIIRHPVDWLNSFWNKPHHLLKKVVKASPTAFLSTPVRSFWRKKPGHPEIMQDRNMNTGKPYGNVIKLRNVKARFLLNEMPKRVKHYIFIRYEDLKNHYDDVLQNIQVKFNLEKRHPTFQKIIYYKGKKGNGEFKEKHINVFGKEVHKKLKLKLEKKLGYNLH